MKLAKYNEDQEEDRKRKMMALEKTNMTKEVMRYTAI